MRRADEARALNSAIVMRVAQTMVRLGLAAIPRNYAIVQEALSGSNVALSRDVAALGSAPRQAELDEIGMKYNLPAHSAHAADEARVEAARAMADFAAKLAANGERKRACTEAAASFVSRLDADPVAALSDFRDAASALKEMLSGLVARDDALAAAGSELAAQLGNLEKRVEAGRAALLRDPVTGLANRTALFNELAGLFDEEGGKSGTALVLVTVEGLRRIGDSHGPEVADKALRKISPAFRRCIKKNDFAARIGHDQFAFLFHDVTSDNAGAITGRLRDAVEAFALPAGTRPLSAGCLSVTAGIAMLQGAHAPWEFFNQAEAARVAARSGSGAPIRLATPETSGAIDIVYGANAA